jgi:hypothetical protein
MTSLETSILNNFSANRFIVERHRSNAHKFSIPDVIDKRLRCNVSFAKILSEKNHETLM